MQSEPPIYEVRCRRCNVSFPVETRKCLHCGGATSRSGDVAILETMVQPSTATAQEFPHPIEFLPSQEDRELEMSDEPSSVGRSLIRSLGGFVWVIVLIGFTLARNCGGE
jgi:hypothetical protein